jgi:hypothetical protein
MDKSYKGNLRPSLQLIRLKRLLLSGHRGTLPSGQLLDASPPLRLVLRALIPTPLCGWYVNYLKVFAYYGDKGLGKAAPGVFGTMQM